MLLALLENNSRKTLSSTTTNTERIHRWAFLPRTKILSILRHCNFNEGKFKGHSGVYIMFKRRIKEKKNICLLTPRLYEKVQVLWDALLQFIVASDDSASHASPKWVVRAFSKRVSHFIQRFLKQVYLSNGVLKLIRGNEILNCRIYRTNAALIKPFFL